MTLRVDETRKCCLKHNNTYISSINKFALSKLRQVATFSTARSKSTICYVKRCAFLCLPSTKHHARHSLPCQRPRRKLATMNCLRVSSLLLSCRSPFQTCSMGAILALNPSMKAPTLPLVPVHFFAGPPRSGGSRLRPEARCLRCW